MLEVISIAFLIILLPANESLVSYDVKAPTAKIDSYGVSVVLSHRNKNTDFIYGRYSSSGKAKLRLLIGGLF